MTGCLQVIIAGFVASLAWFILGGGLYMNPWVAKLYKNHEGSPGLKVWKNQPKYLVTMYLLGILLPTMILAVVFYYLQPALSDSMAMQTLELGLILIGVRMLPRLIDMWLQSTYPNKLLAVEIVNGSILSFVGAAVLVWLL